MSGANGGGLFFLDINILVYSIDRSDLAKQNVAEQLVEDALGTGRGVISTQDGPRD